MLQRTLHGLTLACGVAAAMLAMAVESQAGCRLWDCMFGTAPAAQTTYAPAYAPAPVYTAPACQPACRPACQPTCQPVCQPVCQPSCVPVASPCYAPCASPCAVQSCEYGAYQAYYPPTTVTAYYPPAVVAGYQPVSGVYPLTTYRPFLGTYQTRLVPYTTYRPYYATGIAYAPVVGCASCGGCSSCPSSGCSSCGSGGCGVSYSAPSSGCSSCNVGSAVQSAPASESTSTPRTYESSKPVTNGEQLKPIAQPGPEAQPQPQPQARPSSMPAPALPDPNDRRASRPTYTAQAQLIAQPIPSAPVEEDDGWHAPRK
jgi:hypothetical protein